MVRPELYFDAGTLVLRGVQQQFIMRAFPQGAWVFDGRTGSYRCDALHYPTVAETLNRTLAGGWEDAVIAWREIAVTSQCAAVSVALTSGNHRDSRTAPQPAARTTSVSLRADQMAAVEAWQAARRGCVVMPTGTGKTEVALEIITTTSLSTLIVAPVRDLMYQWHRRLLSRTGIDAGLLGDGVQRLGPVTVTTYDSAFLHMPRIGNQFGLVVFDECHHLPGSQRQDAARMCAAPFRLGLTATPERGDGRQAVLASLIGPICYRQHLAQARGQTLADFDWQRIPVHLSSTERERYDSLSKRIRQYVCKRRELDPGFSWQKLCGESGSDPAARQILRTFRAKQAIEDRAEEKLRVLEDLFRLHVGEPCLIFTGTNAMAREVSRRFLIPCLLSHCGKRERLDILNGLEEGIYPAVVANRILDEGVDLPDVKVAIVIGGSSSPRQATQRLGRILRRSRYGRGVLYEVVTRKTREVERARKRRARA